MFEDPATRRPVVVDHDETILWAELEDSWMLGSEAFDLFDECPSPALPPARIAVSDARSALESFAHTDTDALSDQELLDLIEKGQGVQAMAQAATLRLIAVAEARRATTGRHQLKTSSFLAHHLNVVSVERARELVRLGRLIRERFPAVGAALAAGSVSMDQAEAIVATMRKLPDGLPTETAHRAERDLVELARTHNPRDLRMAANLVVELLAPEVAEADAEAAVRRLDAEADAGRSLYFFDDPVTGGVGLRGVLPPVEGAHLRLLVDALVARPRPGHGGVEAGDDRSATQKRADALMEIVHCYADSGDAPSRGADRPRVNLLVPVEILAGQSGHGLLSDDRAVSGNVARRLACDAVIGLIAVDIKGVPMSVGRATRFFGGELRQALNARDRGCAFPGCDAPPAACDAHHVQPWWDGGKTSLSNGVLLCPYHHRLVEPDPHAPPGDQWEIEIAGDGLPQVRPPVDVDFTCRARRHLRYSIPPLMPFRR
jgi:hypothetical protein